MICSNALTILFMIYLTFRSCSSLVRPLSSLTKSHSSFSKNQLPHFHRQRANGFPPCRLYSQNIAGQPHKQSQSPYFITTPIYYVNGDPHLGHAYTTIICDVMARFCRLDGREVYFLSGTDEHGQKVEQSAAKASQQSLQFADQNSAKFRDLLQILNISNDDFIRTTEQRHMSGVHAIWNKLLANGMIYLGSYDGWYSIRDEAFYAESELVDGKAPTGAEVEWVKEESYFFRLSAFTEKLLDYYEKHPDFIGPKTRRNEVISFVSQEGGLKDLSISRTTFSWGVPVPNDSKHVIYVWLDALTNYLSALGYPDLTNKYPKFWPASVHVVGKDILRFHAIYWPAFLIAADIVPPHRIYAHGWWTKDGEKMSKSIGNVLDPFQLVDKFGIDYLRYFLAADIVFGNDGDFTDEALAGKVNSDLANDIGNLCQRVLTFIAKSCDNHIPTPQDKGMMVIEDREIMNAAIDILPMMRECVNTQNIKEMVELIVSIAKMGNKYIDRQAPWSLRKDNNIDRMNTVLYVLANLIRDIGILLQPIVPASSHLILDQLGIPSHQRMIHDIYTPIQAGIRIGVPSPIFPKVEIIPAMSIEDSMKGQEVTSGEVKPGSTSCTSSKSANASNKKVNSALLAMYDGLDLEQLRLMIVKVGDEIKAMKAQRAEKCKIQEKVSELLALKECFRIKNHGHTYESTFVPASHSKAVGA